jgi:hypothetical protein
MHASPSQAINGNVLDRACLGYGRSHSRETSSSVVIELVEIHGFGSPQHFSEFQGQLEDAVLAGELAPVDVEDRYGSLMFEEKWYRLSSGEIWRLVSPDFPFKGVFRRV